jgi:hypothetical protein
VVEHLLSKHEVKFGAKHKAKYEALCEKSTTSGEYSESIIASRIQQSSYIFKCVIIMIINSVWAFYVTISETRNPNFTLDFSPHTLLQIHHRFISLNFQHMTQIRSFFISLLSLQARIIYLSPTLLHIMSM